MNTFSNWNRALSVGALAIVTFASAKFASAQDAKPSKELTQAQFETRQQKQFFKADKDANKLVSKQEFIAARPKGDPDKLGKRFDRIDANHDGAIDATELTAMLDRRFKRLDKDGNGVLSAAERPGNRTQTNGQKNG